MDVKAGKGKGVYKFSMAISPLDCMGCSVCVSICPAKALTMVPQESQADQQDVFDYMVAKVSEKEDMAGPDRQGQPVQAAPAGVLRLLRRLRRDRLCPSRHPAVRRPDVYLQRHRLLLHLGRSRRYLSLHRQQAEGQGPAWANSLFEDNAEHGLGLYLGQKAIRNRLADETRELIAVEWARPELKAAAQKWLDTMEDGEANAEAAKAYVAALEDSICTVDELAAVPSSQSTLPS